MGNTSTTRRTFIQAAAGLGASALTGFQPAWAAFPDMPARIVVPYGTGGPNDMLARVVAQALASQSGQSVIVENRPGGGATIGGAIVAKGPADGLTLLLGSSTFATHPSLFANLPYDPARDLVPAVKIADGPIILTAHPSLPVHSVAELIDYAHKHPGTLNYGTPGNASTPHLAGEYFNLKTRAGLVHVPHKSDGAALVSVLGATTQLAFTGLTGAIPHVKAGKLKALGVSSKSRLDALADVPAIGEAIPDFELVGWFSLMVPARTPPATQSAIAKAVLAAVDHPEIRSKLAGAGLYIAPLGPAEAQAYFNSEIRKLGELIKSANIKVE